MWFNRTATVPAGMVLDHLNAELKQHACGIRCDSRPANRPPLGALAGNNSCGSRSIVYGNMVTTWLGATAWLWTARWWSSDPSVAHGPRARPTGRLLRQLADTHRSAIEANWPKVLRRVGGYNRGYLSIRKRAPLYPRRQCQPGHLLIRLRRHVGLHPGVWSCNSRRCPRGQVLGVVNFPTFHRCNGGRSAHLCGYSHSGGVGGPDHDRLALANPYFGVISRALIGSPAAILLVEFPLILQRRRRRWLAS